MRAGPPQVGLVGGRVVAKDGTRPLALIWLLRDGRVVAKIPPLKGNFQWLHNSVGIRSPHLEGGSWHLPRNCLSRLVIAAVDRYGSVVVCRDMAQLSRCTRACLEATGADCNCSCYGAYHGQDSAAWYERVGDAVVADLGDHKRSVIVYGARGSTDEGVVYRGELSGRPCRPDRAGRRNWPAASRFMCGACLSERAQVWDHCHTHGFVRAPLCNTCNSRHWRGWHPQHGRAIPSDNLDTSYYTWCPRYRDELYERCTA